MALFGTTAKDWRKQNPDKEGNIRDYANVNQLVCLANLENLNAVFINEGLEQSKRLQKLNKIAIGQMKILLQSSSSVQKIETKATKKLNKEDDHFISNVSPKL